MHHPTEWLEEGIDRPHIEGLLARKCHFILHGHLHSNQIVGEMAPDGKSFKIMAGASFQRRTTPSDYNGYNFVRLDLGAPKGTIYMRYYSPSRGGFWTADVISYPDMPDGRYTFDLPTSLRT